MIASARLLGTGRTRALCAIAFLELVRGASVHAAQEMFRLREVGEPVHRMVLHDLEGAPRTFDPGNLERPALLLFWSVYCPNCKEAMPDLVRFAGSATGLDIWGINVDGERFSNAVRSYVQNSRLPFPIVYDRLEGEYLVAADPLGVAKTPTLYLVGRDGRVLLRQVVQIDLTAVRNALPPADER